MNTTKNEITREYIKAQFAVSRGKVVQHGGRVLAPLFEKYGKDTVFAAMREARGIVAQHNDAVESQEWMQNGKLLEKQPEKYEFISDIPVW